MPLGFLVWVGVFFPISNLLERLKNKRVENGLDQVEKSYTELIWQGTGVICSPLLSSFFRYICIETCPSVEAVFSLSLFYLLNRNQFCLSKPFLLACLHSWLCMRRNKLAIFVILPKWRKFLLQIRLYYSCPRVILFLYQGNTTR